MSLRAVLVRFREAVVGRTLLVGAILSAVLALLIWPGLGLNSPVYEVGEIAPRTIRAQRDFTYDDEATTEARRREAVEQVPDVYNFDAQARDSVRAGIARAFEMGRASLEAAAEEEPEFREAFEASLGVGITSPEFDLLVDVGFGLEVEQALADSVTSVLARDILSEKGALAVLGRSIQRRDLDAGVTHVLGDMSNVLSVEEARRAAELQVLALSDLRGAQRQTLSGIASRLVRPTLERDEVVTTRLRNDAAQSVDPAVFQVRRGRTLVRVGEEVTEHARRQMLEMRASSPPPSGWAGLGALLFACALIGLNRGLLRPARSGKRWVRYAFAMTGTLIVTHLVIVRGLSFLSRAIAAQAGAEAFADPALYNHALPVASVAIVAVVLENQPTAVLATTLFATALALMTGDLAFGAFALLSGLAALFVYVRTDRRMQLLRVGAMVGVLAAALLTAISLVRGAPVDVALVLNAGAALAGGLFSALTALVLLPVFEAVFERTSAMRLAELGRRDHPILRRLALVAPGTYQHSVLVAILAETAAEAIGANATLCSTAALYHDIGKINRAKYFVENSRGESLHDEMAPEASADVIRAHVTEGIEDARRLNLPPDIVDVIPQHHGTRRIQVFYERAREAAEANGAGTVDESRFRYDGPRPQTREAAIVMMADSVEAAARSVREPTREELTRVIERIMSSLVEDDQLIECDLTLRDMRRIRECFLSTLEGINHPRVDYPGFEFRPKDLA